MTKEEGHPLTPEELEELKREQEEQRKGEEETGKKDGDGKEGEQPENKQEVAPQVPNNSGKEDGPIDAPDMVLTDSFFKGESGEFDGGQWIDETMKPIEDALKSGKTMDEAVLNLFFAIPEAVGKAFLNPLEQWAKDEKERSKKGKEERKKFFDDQIKSGKFGRAASDAFQKWALSGLQYAPLEGTKEMTRARKAALERGRFVASLPRTPEGRIDWERVSKDDRKKYLSSLRAFALKNKDFKRYMAGQMGIVLKKDEAKKLFDQASQQRGSVAIDRGTVDGFKRCQQDWSHRRGENTKDLKAIREARGERGGDARPDGRLPDGRFPDYEPKRERD